MAETFLLIGHIIVMATFAYYYYLTQKMAKAYSDYYEYASKRIEELKRETFNNVTNPTPSQRAEMIIRYIREIQMPCRFESGELSTLPVFWGITYSTSAHLIDEILKSFETMPVSEEQQVFYKQVRIEIEKYK